MREKVCNKLYFAGNLSIERLRRKYLFGHRTLEKEVRNSIKNFTIFSV